MPPRLFALLAVPENDVALTVVLTDELPTVRTVELANSPIEVALIVPIFNTEVVFPVILTFPE